MVSEGISIIIKVENYEELMLQIEDIRRSAQASVDILTAMGGLIARGGYCPHCGKKIINEEENNV